MGERPQTAPPECARCEGTGREVITVEMARDACEPRWAGMTWCCGACNGTGRDGTG